MTVAAMRKRVHDLINDSDEVALVEILAKLEGDTNAPWEWHNDEEFLAELDEQVRRREEGIDKGYTLEEVKTNMAQWKEQRAKMQRGV